MSEPRTPSGPDTEARLLEIENAFAEFEGVASPKHAAVMDDLVRVWLSLARARILPLAETPPSAAPEALQAVRELKLRFMRTRFLVRDCDSFRTLSPVSRGRLADLLFEAPETRGVVK